MIITWPQHDLLWAAVAVLAVTALALAAKVLWTWIQRKGRRSGNEPED
jgi:hypothetical protein